MDIYKWYRDEEGNLICWYNFESVGGGGNRRN
jgi:hypothetical protein